MTTAAEPCPYCGYTPCRWSVPCDPLAELQALRGAHVDFHHAHFGPRTVHDYPHDKVIRAYLSLDEYVEHRCIDSGKADA